MKKSKVILAVVLAIVLVITCLSIPTFSWFSRPNSQSGEKAVFGGADGSYALNAYNGKSVTVETKASTTGKDDTYTVPCSNSSDFSGSGIPNNNRKYFCTTLTNNSGGVQNVSLYARTLSVPSTNNGTLAIGANSPTRSYHDYSTLAAKTATTNRDAMRIYFQKPKSAPDGWAGTEFYICWGDNLNRYGSNGTYYHMSYCGEKDNYYNYYADIPMSAKQAFFACENWGDGKPESAYNADNWKRRTQTQTNLFGDGQSQLQSVVYRLSNTVENGNTKVDGHYNVGGACINHYYSSIFVATGSTNSYDASLGNTNNIPTRAGYSANYIGSMEYYSGNTSVFTVGKTTGIITPVAAGEAILYTKAIGSSYSDSQQVETTVKVTATSDYVFNDVPIVKNIMIPGSTEQNANVVKVYWYVINNSPTTALSYTIDSVYVGL